MIRIIMLLLVLRVCCPAALAESGKLTPDGSTGAYDELVEKYSDDADEAAEAA